MDDIEKAIKSQLFANSYWENNSNEQWNFVGLEYRLQEVAPEERAALVKGCKALLTDPDVEIRTGIVAVLNEIAEDVGAEWMYAKLMDHPELFVGVTPVGADLMHKTLDRHIITAISSVAKKSDAKIIAHMREWVRIPDWGSWVLNDLTKIDGDWVVANAEDIV